MAALYLAAHPYAVLYGRSIWAQNLLIPLAVGWLLLATLATRPSPPRWAVGGAAFLTGFALQVHFAGAALLLPGAYAAIRWRWWRYPVALITGGGLAILAALPFMLAPGALADVLRAAAGPSQIDLAAWLPIPRLLFGHGWAYLLHGSVDLPLTRLTPAMVSGGLIGLLVVVLVIAALLWLAPRFPPPDAPSPPPAPDPPPGPPPSASPELPLVLLLASPLLFTRHSTPVFIHYLLMSLPAAALLIGWAAANARPAWLRGLVAVGVVILALGWTGQLTRALPYAGEVHTPNGLPEPLGTLRYAAHTTDDTRPVLYFTHGDDPTTQGEPAIFRALWWQRGDAARVLDGRHLLILPDTPATLMFTERAFQAWEEADQAKLLADVIPVPRRAGIAPFERAPYDGEAAPAGFTRLDEPIRFANGAVLRGWRAYQVGPRTRVSTLWAAPGPLDDNLHQFHHLRTAATRTGEPLAVSDVPVRAHTWRAGDTVIVMADFFDLDPQTTYTLEIGQYTLPSLTRIPHTDGGDRVRLGALQPGTIPAR